MAGKKSKSHKKLILTGKLEAQYNDFLIQIGNRIRLRRNELRLIQDDLDTAPLPIDERNFRRIEAGKSNVTAKTLFAICRKLKIQPRDLFDFDIDI